LVIQKLKMARGPFDPNMNDNDYLVNFVIITRGYRHVTAA
jgi:hypothetical protein